MKVYIGADHRGFHLKQGLISWMQKNDWDVEDIGAYSFDEKDDYTLFAEKVALLVARNNANKGILLCGSGVGVDIIANKFDNVRSGIGLSQAQVEAGRMDDNMNILVIAADFVNEKDAKAMITAFLKTPFSGKVRHKRRLAEISRIEENN